MQPPVHVLSPRAWLSPPSCHARRSQTPAAGLLRPVLAGKPRGPRLGRSARRQPWPYHTPYVPGPARAAAQHRLPRTIPWVPRGLGGPSPLPRHCPRSRTSEGGGDCFVILACRMSHWGKMPERPSWRLMSCAYGEAVGDAHVLAGHWWGLRGSSWPEVAFPRCCCGHRGPLGAAAHRGQEFDSMLLITTSAQTMGCDPMFLLPGGKALLMRS